MKSAVPSSVWLLLKVAVLASVAILFATLWRATRDAPQPAEADGETHGPEVDRVAREVLRIEQVLRIPDVELRNREEAILAATIPCGDIPAILDRLSDSRRSSLYAGVIAGRWAADDPAAAAAWSDRLRGTRSHAGLLATIVGTWADDDGASAIAWARTLGEQTDREVALAEISRVMVSRDPRLALELANETGRRDLIQDCLRDWAQRDPAEAARWSLTVTDPALRTAATVEVVSEWARQDLAAAGGFVVDGMPDDERMEHAILAVISQAGPADLPMLREWIGSFPEAPLKQLSRAELTRLERLLPSSPASLPGEADEDRAPLVVSPSKPE